MEKKKRGSCGTILLVIIGIVIVAMVFRVINGRKNNRPETAAEQMPVVTQAPEEELPEIEESELDEEIETDDFGELSEVSVNDTGAATEPDASQESVEASSNIPVIGVTPEFKAAMDSYEAFFDEYVEFMKKYSNSDDQLSMMNDYLSYLERYSEVMEKLDAIDEDQLSDADMAYYIEVNARIEKKLLEVSVV